MSTLWAVEGSAHFPFTQHSAYISFQPEKPLSQLITAFAAKIKCTSCKNCHLKDAISSFRHILVPRVAINVAQLNEKNGSSVSKNLAG